MHRTSLLTIQKWFSSKPRNPLVIRGARQVGKTWLVKHFAETEGLKLIDVNLERAPGLAKSFNSNIPEEIIRELSAALNVSIEPSKCLLFIDEIQAAPELYAKLRWFAEDFPELAVIAAGSLLEHALYTERMSMPVGRVSFLFLEPLSFIEFLLARKQSALVEYIQTYEWSTETSQGVHEALMKYFKEYLIVGGLPRAVQTWIDSSSWQEVNEVLSSLAQTYREDFRSYSTPATSVRLEEIFQAIPRNLASKFTFSKINKDVKAELLREAVRLLAHSRVCHIVYKADANGLPLGAGINMKFFKVIFVDVGLVSAVLNYSYTFLKSIDEIDFINKGGIAEQVTGQLLRTIGPSYIDPQLYYWTRAESSAEVDYIIQHNNLIIPLEVKAGREGSLKSLHLFMEEKKLSLALRVNSLPPYLSQVETKNREGKLISYELRSIPFYLISEIHRLLP